MPVVTFGDVLTQLQGITGIRDSEPEAIAALKEAINTAHAKATGIAIAKGWPWTVQQGIALAVTATDDYVVLPDGSTVTAADGVTIPARCSQVISVRLLGRRLGLTRVQKDVWEGQHSRLQEWSRGTPDSFDPYGVDAQGRSILWLMPMAGAAMTAYVDYIGDVSYLTSPSQALLIPEGIPRHLVAQMSIVCASARSTIDPGIRAQAQLDADYFLDILNCTAPGYKPRHAVRETLTQR